MLYAESESESKSKSMSAPESQSECNARFTQSAQPVELSQKSVHIPHGAGLAVASPAPAHDFFPRPG